MYRTEVLLGISHAQQMILIYLIMGLLSGITGFLFGDGRFDTAENSEIAFIIRSCQL